MIQILIVDDEPDIASMLAQALSQHGCKLTTARTAMGAAQALRRARYDAVILDVNLGGGLSGIELAWKIRKSDERIKILIFSAIHHGPEIEREIAGLSAIFFEKPTSATKILQAVGAVS
jgi:two-component system OmpR family response regulator